ncbi:MAG: Asd/ArgC dimerization domain-containing protein [Terriglobia bacterium]
MKAPSLGFQVGIAGASSLLGQELVRVLDERAFPVSRLLTFEAEEEEPDLPVLDLSGGLETQPAVTGESAAELDFLFLADRPRASSGLSPLLSPVLEAARASAPGRPGRCGVIDMADALGESAGPTPAAISRIPFLERAAPNAQPSPHARLFTSMHPAAIALSALVTRLAARLPLKSIVAQIFSPVSEMGSRAIDELQKQTTSLLSFQPVPQKMFGAQLAFNLLPHLGGKRDSEFAARERLISSQVRNYLAGRFPVPALKVTQVPVFYSLALSVYVETAGAVAPEAAEAALAGERLRVRRRGEPAPSPVGAAGSGDILVDHITPDAGYPQGFWIWATVDNVRLAAENAVEIAQYLSKR